MTENFFCYLLVQLKLRRLETTLTSGVGRTDLRRCPDMSRKRDGIVVSALSRRNLVGLMTAALNFYFLRF